tara:strand:- start:19 stop:258 length:240 start_codon:yes stop_codon:yes gene_type:complete
MDNKIAILRLVEMEKHAKFCVEETRGLCANRDVEVHEGVQDEDKLVFTWVNVNNGCENDKRHASKHCQDCSDNYKKQNA